MPEDRRIDFRPCTHAHTHTHPTATVLTQAYRVPTARTPATSACPSLNLRILNSSPPTPGGIWGLWLRSSALSTRSFHQPEASISPKPAFYKPKGCFVTWYCQLSAYLLSTQSLFANTMMPTLCPTKKVLEVYSRSQKV